MKTPPPGTSGIAKTLPSARMIDRTKDPRLVGDKDSLLMTPGGTRMFNDSIQALLEQQRKWADDKNKATETEDSDTDSTTTGDENDLEGIS